MSRYFAPFENYIENYFCHYFLFRHLAFQEGIKIIPSQKDAVDSELVDIFLTYIGGGEL